MRYIISGKNIDVTESLRPQFMKRSENLNVISLLKQKFM
jgi:hypothetical protein